MNTRLRQIIDYKTNGKKKAFAELIGWKPQYLGKLLHGDDFGLKPVIALLTALPEINARWLLTGEGEMFARTAPKHKQQKGNGPDSPQGKCPRVRREHSPLFLRLFLKFWRFS